MNAWHAMERDPHHCTYKCLALFYACKGQTRVPMRASALGGQVLDGRNHVRTCADADILSRLEPYTVADPVAYAVSLNLRRRREE